jgi:hypothetical protein
MEHLPNLAEFAHLLVNSIDGILVDIRCVLVFADPGPRLEPSGPAAERAASRMSMSQAYQVLLLDCLTRSYP